MSPVITLGTKLTAPRGKRNDSSDNFEWKKDLTHYFIDQRQTEPCLYNVNNPNFHLKDKRMPALSRILESTVQNLLDKISVRIITRKKVSTMHQKLQGRVLISEMVIFSLSAFFG